MALCALSTLIGCQAGPNAKKGAALGGVAGAAVGGIVGHQSGRGLEGAAIGAAGGAAAGGLMGSARDQENQRTSPYANSNY